MTSPASWLSPEWHLALSRAGAWAAPADAAAGEWHPAPVPGTAAAALEQAGLWDRQNPAPLHDQDVWYRTTIAGTGPATLLFEGLATIAELWLDDGLVARSDGMFTPLEVPLGLAGTHRLSLVFRSLAAELATRAGPRARWRTRMVDEPKLRLVRTTFLGHAPRWCPPIHAVGPWRPVRLLNLAEPTIRHLRSVVEDRDGVLTLAVDIPSQAPGDEARLKVGSHETALVHDADGLWHATLRIPDVALWWPKSHGHPHLYDLSVVTPAETFALGRTGFRTLALERGPSGAGFDLHVNGTRIFCRGLCWTPDPVTLGSTRAELEPTLRALAAAHVNMLRIGGTMVYESADFHALCDELGILVWQDCMLANFDYPRDDAFTGTVLGEVTALLRRTMASPSLAILCGGSEILQQASMMGLPPATSAHPLFDIHLPALLASERPDLIYVPGSPSGGALPFVSDHGPSHYYGVGAYGRPLDDARRANIRFASECLAFSNVPEDATLARFRLDPQGDADGWAAGIPRDNGADWTFEDTRHRYMVLLHGVEPAGLRQADPRRYLDLSRAVTAEVTERTFDEWRRPGSPTAGGLVWFARDLRPGAGWGVLDVTGRPKSNFYALQRAFAPLRLSISDEGVNGLVLHAVNDGAAAVTGRLTIECLRAGATRVMKGSQEVIVPARGGISIAAFTLFGCFFDAGCAYGFGAPQHDIVTGTLERDGNVEAEAFWHPQRASETRHEAAPSLTIEPADEHGWRLTLLASRALRSVVIADRALVPDDNWFHLAPGRPKTITLRPMPGQEAVSPLGEIRALDLAPSIPYG